MHYHTTTARQRKKIIRQIDSILNANNLDPTNALTVCKYIVQSNSEDRQCAYKYFRWYSNKDQYLKLNNKRFNVTGQGRKRTADRKQLFDAVTKLFTYYRYEIGITVLLWDIADFFVKATQDLNMNYQDEHSYEDAKAWQRSLHAGKTNINGKIKFKPEYIAAKVAQNQTKLLLKMRQNNIAIHRVVSVDETMVWCDFAVGSVTLSLPCQNTPVHWISNNKDTYSFICIWHWNKYAICSKNPFFYSKICSKNLFFYSKILTVFCFLMQIRLRCIYYRRI